MDEAYRASIVEETRRRRNDQHSFLKYWFEITRGPPKTEEWRYNNREAYKTDLDRIVKEEDATGVSNDFAHKGGGRSCSNSTRTNLS